MPGEARETTPAIVGGAGGDGVAKTTGGVSQKATKARSIAAASPATAAGGGAAFAAENPAAKAPAKVLSAAVSETAIGFVVPANAPSAYFL